jgi:uncharacterized protein involved in cysteine biosynthesis
MESAVKENDPEIKQVLWQEIKRFRKNKFFIFFFFLVLAAIGFIIPIIPGIVLLILALAFIKKGWMAGIRKHIRFWRIK